MKGGSNKPEYALLVKDVPEEAEVSLVEETFQSFKALGGARYNVANIQTRCLMVICECHKTVIVRAILLDVLPEGGDNPCRILGVSDE